MAQPDRDDNSPADPPPVRPTEPSDTAQQFQLVMAELRKTRDDMQQNFDMLQEEIAGRAGRCYRACRQEAEGGLRLHLQKERTRTPVPLPRRNRGTNSESSDGSNQNQTC